MTVTVPSFAKINLGLRIGALRPDGFHELRTVYQTIALHDEVRVSVERGRGIEIRCTDSRVPTDSTNTCWKVIDRAIPALKVRGRVIIEIEKRLPVQGGLGGASGNAIAALVGLERTLQKQLAPNDRLRIAAAVGSDLPLFLIGGTVLGIGHGEEVYPLPELPPTACVIALPEVAVSTPKAFAEWDKLADGESTTSNRADSNHDSICDSGPSLAGEESPRRTGVTPEEKQVPVRLLPFDQSLRAGSRLGNHSQANDSTSLGMTSVKMVFKESGNPSTELTHEAHSDKMSMFSREISAWLAAVPEGERRRSGVSAEVRRGGRAESPLLDLVRTGIENDFEQVVFLQYPELCQVKRVLESSGAQYASLSGSGSAVYGLFQSRGKAIAAAQKLEKQGTRAVVTATLTRRQYWKKVRAVSS